MRSAPSIGFEYRPSRALALCALAILALALAAIVLGGLANWVAVVLIVAALCGGALALRRFLRPSVRALTWRGDGGVSIRIGARDGGLREAQGELRAARVFGPLIVLSLRWPPRGQASLWLLPDNLDADTRRRLRVRLTTDGARPASVNADSV